MITNRQLLEANDCSVLKPDLIEHHDYEAVSADVWKHLSSWYHYDIEISRPLYYDMRSGKTQLELYPGGTR